VTPSLAIRATACDTVRATIDVGRWPERIALDPETDLIYVADYESQAVSVINGRTGLVTATIGLSAQPFGIAVDPVTDMIYVSGAIGAPLSVIDGLTNTATTVPLPPYTITGVPNDIAVDPVTDRIYLITGEGYVYVFNGRTNKLTSQRLAAPEPSGRR